MIAESAGRTAGLVRRSVSFRGTPAIEEELYAMVITQGVIQPKRRPWRRAGPFRYLGRDRQRLANRSEWPGRLVTRATIYSGPIFFYTARAEQRPPGRMLGGREPPPPLRFAAIMMRGDCSVD